MQGRVLHRGRRPAGASRRAHRLRVAPRPEGDLRGRYAFRSGAHPAALECRVRLPPHLGLQRPRDLGDGRLPRGVQGSSALKLVAIALVTIALPALAQTSSLQLHGYLTGRLIRVDSIPSWTERDYGKFDVGSDAA